MSRLVLPNPLLDELRSQLLANSVETCAVLIGRALTRERLARIVIREFIMPRTEDYSKRTTVAAQLRPEFVSSIAQRARRTGDSLVFAHSHPFPMNAFSEVDDEGEAKLAEFLQRRIPAVTHASLLITPEVAIARSLGSDQQLNVLGIGSSIAWNSSNSPQLVDPTYNRQSALFGASGQDRLKKLRVGIVGLGGTGSIISEQLAHLGVGKFLLIDPDTVEETNLNRLVGASVDDVGKPKVEVAAAHIHRINHKANIQPRIGSVLLSEVADELADTDFVFCCTDSQGSRAVLNQVAYQYLVPVIDMGVGIIVEKGCISRIAGRTQMLAPGLGCLICGNLLDPEAVRVDLLTHFERSADPYISGVHEPAPAVISLNATVSSFAITMFLSAVVGIPSVGRLINYNGIAGTARVGIIATHPQCIVCSPSGALARGNAWPLPGRLS
jgi:molybdopterin/thiamine biosynthesis adenylyltransferase